MIPVIMVNVWLVICLGIGILDNQPVTNQDLSLTTSDFQWGRSTPESMGLSTKRLDLLQQDLERRGTKKFLVIKNDHIIYDWYANGWEDSSRNHYTASMAKAIVGGLSLLVALDEGWVSADMPVCNLVPEWKSHPQKSKITIRQLATHTSGLDDAEVNSEVQALLREKGIDTHKQLPGWKGQFWRHDPDPFTVSRDSTTVLFTPGSGFNYSNPGIAMLSYAVTASLAKSKHTDIRSLLWERIYGPVGIDRKQLSTGYGKDFQVNGLSLVPSWGGGSSSAEAAARLARLMLKNGNWNGQQLVSATQVKEVLTYANTAVPGNQPAMVSDSSSLRYSDNPYPASTMGWYSNFDKVWKYVPQDAFAAAGAGHQLILVVPSQNLIVIRFGDDLSGQRDDGFWLDAEHYLFNPIMDAFDSSPYPQSKKISRNSVCCKFRDRKNG